MTSAMPDALQHRLWRARRRHDHLDAALDDGSGAWTLKYLLNDRPILEWRFDTREAATAEADRRLRDLLRAGWNVHW